MAESTAPAEAPVEVEAAPAGPTAAEIAAWAVGRGIRTTGGVDPGHVEAYHAERARDL